MESRKIAEFTSDGKVFEVNNEVNILRDELESLYSEIFPVAQMSVEQQYLGPAIHMITKETTILRYKWTLALEYVSTIERNKRERAYLF